MVYLDGISAFEFWTSTARTKFGAWAPPRFSSLEGCPACAAESAPVVFDKIPCKFSQIVLAVPDSSFRVQRSRFRYRVWPNGIPPESFMMISRGICVASPALALAELNMSLGTTQLTSVICEMEGGYLRVRGKDNGAIDRLAPIVTEREIRAMADTLRGTCKCKRLLTALDFALPGSRSPKETELLLLMSLTKRRGGAAIGGWEMNPSLDVPCRYRRYLEKDKVFPDLYHRKENLVIEYDSHQEHDAAHKLHEDKKREIVLESMGNTVVSVRPEQMASAEIFENLVKKVRGLLGIPHRPTSPEGLAARGRLMDELRSDPPIGYPL